MDPALNVVVPTRQRLAVVWLIVAALLGSLLVLAQIARSGLDDADPARQRPGFLDAGSLPQPAPPLGTDHPRPGHRLVLFFVRTGDVGLLCRSISASDLDRRTDLIVAAAGPGRCGAAAVVVDPHAQLARDYGLAEPRNGTAPVGYAVVDRNGQIRYRTLDPAVPHDLSEIDTVLRATP